MNKYLDLLEKFKNCKDNESDLPLIKKVESYVKGEITSKELIEGADEFTIGKIQWVINDLLNYEEKDIRYYVELPQDMFFNNGEPDAIIAARERDYELGWVSLNTVGPEYEVKRNDWFFRRYFSEITGDFSKYPNGVMLYQSDWYRIIAKYPYLYERMHDLITDDYEFRDKYKDLTTEQTKKIVDAQIAKKVNAPRDGEPRIHWAGKEFAEYLPQEVIDSIEFVVRTKFLSRDQILSGNFGTFEELVNGNKTNVAPDTEKKKPIITTSDIGRSVLTKNEKPEKETPDDAALGEQ